jgi:hypothetical protein
MVHHGVTPARHTRGMGARTLELVEARGEARGRFAEVALTGLVGLGGEPPGGGELALTFGLSAWMRLAGVGLAEAASVLADLRGALLAGAGLERRGEPVPFRVPDPRQDLLLLAGYLGDLLTRAARATGSDRATLATRALEALAD